MMWSEIRRIAFVEYSPVTERKRLREARSPKRHGIKIPYHFLFIIRHYLPDFLIEFNDGGKEIHETKGLPLLFLLSTKLKKTSAEDYCRKLGWKYKFITRERVVFYRNNFLSSNLGTVQDLPAE